MSRADSSSRATQTKAKGALSKEERETLESLKKKTEGTPVAEVCEAMLQSSENLEANS